MLELIVVNLLLVYNVIMFKQRKVNRCNFSNKRGIFNEQDDQQSINQSQSQSQSAIHEKHLLRKLKRTSPGIDVDKLVSGGNTPDNKRSRLDQDIEQDNHSNHSTNSNFTTHSPTINVDKAMMVFIEEELKRRKGDTHSLSHTPTPTQLNDPSSELYAIAQQYTPKHPHKQPAHDGSITRSESMLTTIPEVDLGVDAKLRNIENTEKAKQRFKHTSNHLDQVDNSNHSQIRFSQPSLIKSRIDSSSLLPINQQDAINDYRQSGKASDDDHYSRFRRSDK
ncbi:hypothetical protein E3P98_02920 [Wallemia ichthyophaga]|nr:hypothetical protein E3P98_02920 [Wallemia ichthyophaga]